MNTDSTIWKKISGTFVAQGGEKNITIGNFRDADSTGIQFIQNSSVYQGAYYYIDDVSVEEVLNANAGNDASVISSDSVQIGNNPTENATYLWQPATGLSDVNAANPKTWVSSTIIYTVTKTQCSITTTDTVVVYSLVNVNEDSYNTDFKVYPNPVAESFSVELKEPAAYKLEISNNLGELLYEQILNSGTETISTSQLANGVYFLKVQNIESDACFYNKIVISH